jgi:hypothetical protein
MTFRSIATMILVTVSVAHAQEGHCDVTQARTVEHLDGVVVHELTLTGAWGANKARALLPDERSVESDIVFSHSVIHSEDGTSTDLFPFALTLAQAGAAVIVPERSLMWPQKDSSMNREGGLVMCAARWLVENAKVPDGGERITNDEPNVIREFYAYVGPRICDQTISGDCHLTSPLDSSPHRQHVWVPLGETEGHDNTMQVIADRGLSSAQWLQKRLGLRPIDSIHAHPRPSSGT